MFTQQPAQELVQADPPSFQPVAKAQGGGVAAKAGAVVNGADGRFVSSDKLTPKQQVFIQTLVNNGANWTAAARVAGYADPKVSAWTLRKNPVILAAIAQERAQVIEGGACRALAVLDSLMNDTEINPETRFKCAKWYLEAAGHGAIHKVNEAPADDKPLSERSIAELDAYIQAGATALQTLAAQRDAALAATPFVNSTDEAAEAPSLPGSLSDQASDADQQ